MPRRSLPAAVLLALALALPLAGSAFIKVGAFTPASFHAPPRGVDAPSQANAFAAPPPKPRAGARPAPCSAAEEAAQAAPEPPHGGLCPALSRRDRRDAAPDAAPGLRGGQGGGGAPHETPQDDFLGGLSRRDAFKLGVLLPLLSELAFAAPRKANGKLMGMEEELSRIFDDTVPSVCFISTEYTSIAEQNNIDTLSLPKGVGSGFVWDKKGHIVTNFHVINKVDNAIVTLTDAKGNTEKYKAKLTGVDPDKDIAVLKINVSPDQLTPISVGESTGLRVGQLALAIGNPFGQDHTLTTGVVSGKNRQITAPTGRKINGVIQTDAAINPGNSGGPLLDSSGRLIGINTATLGAGVNAGVSFALPIDGAREAIEQLIQFGQAQRAVLGISYLERLPSAAEAESSGIPRIEKGVVVLEVPPNSPCAKAGMRAVSRPQGGGGGGEGGEKPVLGDVIVGIEQWPIDSAADMTPVMERFKPGQTVTIHVHRGPELRPADLTVRLGAFKGSAFSKIESDRPQVPEEEGPSFNISLGDIAPQISPQLPAQ